jgi:hypothetical protein
MLKIKPKPDHVTTRSPARQPNWHSAILAGALNLTGAAFSFGGIAPHRAAAILTAGAPDVENRSQTPKAHGSKNLSRPQPPSVHATPTKQTR